MLRLYTLGRLIVHGIQGPLTGAAAQPKRLAVLALLAASGERGRARDQLATMLWPDAPEENARRSVAQALYALRQELGSDEAILGTRDLRLNPELVASDLAEFDRAIKEGRFEDAVELYGGPFLDGFRLGGSAELERWIEQERRALAERFLSALSRLAARATERSDHEAAVVWWRRIAAQDPLSAKHAAGLMRALAAAGDVQGALHHARIYEMLVAQELELPPDPAIVRLSDELRASPSSGQSAVPASLPAPATLAVTRSVNAEPPAEAPSSSTPSTPQPLVPNAGGIGHQLHRYLGRFFFAGTLVAAIGILFAASRRGAADKPSANEPVIVVGRITDYTGTAAAAGPLGDMLATNLARSPGLQVVSGARMHELLNRVAENRNPTSDDVHTVATRAGASEIVDGAVYQLADSSYRLDLRRVDIATGRVRAGYSVKGADLFATADSATARLVDALGSARPNGSIANVTTRSIAAYRLYELGLQAYARSETPTADRLFAAALAEDPQFAMAALYHSMTASDPASTLPRLARALPLARRASERERLIIEARWAEANQDPGLSIIADSLIRRYPLELAGHLSFARALRYEGRTLEAIRSLRRVVALDSLGAGGDAARCRSCEALHMIVDAYLESDSLTVAIHTAREWTELQPRNVEAHTVLAYALSCAGRTREALAAYGTAQALNPAMARGASLNAATLFLRSSDFGRADSLLAEALASPLLDVRREALWWRHYSLRAQGRLQEALTAARLFRALDTVPVHGVGAVRGGALLQAIALFDAGRYRESVAVYDSLARREIPDGLPTLELGQRLWILTHAASGLFEAGDSTRLGRLADSLELLGRTNPLGRNRRLHHYVRGLLNTMRGRHGEAARELGLAIGSPNMGYSRISLALAEALRHDPSRVNEAVGVLQATFRSGLDGSSLYATTTERHEALADAWRDAGGRDSAVAHYEIVARAWERGDPPFKARALRAKQVAASLAAVR